MKALILEDPKEHSKSIAQGWMEGILKKHNYEIEMAKNQDEAKSKLESDCFKVVIIHHTNFKDLNFLKQTFPDINYIGYCGDFESFKNHKKGSIGHEFVTRMKESYDYVISIKYGLRKVLKDLSNQKR